MEKFTSDGMYLLEWPIASDRADHVAVDSSGDVYVTGFTDQAVSKYTASGDPLDILGELGSGRVSSTGRSGPLSGSMARCMSPTSPLIESSGSGTLEPTWKIRRLGSLQGRRFDPRHPTRAERV